MKAALEQPLLGD